MGRSFALFVLATVITVIAAFTLQNASYTTPLQLNLWFAAWRLRDPVSVPTLMWASFGLGFGLSALGGLWRRASLQREIQKLRQQVALGGVGGGRASDGWSG